MENEWHYYALIVGIEDSVFWHLTPKTIQIYFKAYNKRRQTQIQDLWLQGKYFGCAIASTLQFSKQKPPEYPEMPYQDEDNEQLAQNEDWVKAQRQIAYDHFVRILSKKR